VAGTESGAFTAAHVGVLPTPGHAAIRSVVADDRAGEAGQDVLMMTVTDSDHELASAETAVSVLIGGLLVVVFGLAAVLTAIGIGWMGAATLAAILLALAWKVPVRKSARVLPLLAAGFGVLALLGAIFDLVT
jgi:hypothetical protein